MAEGERRMARFHLKPVNLSAHRARQWRREDTHARVLIMGFYPPSLTGYIYNPEFSPFQAQNQAQAMNSSNLPSNPEFHTSEKRQPLG